MPSISYLCVLYLIYDVPHKLKEIAPFFSLNIVLLWNYAAIKQIAQEKEYGIESVASHYVNYTKFL